MRTRTTAAFAAAALTAATLSVAVLGLAATTSPAAAAISTYTVADVTPHNSAASCWTIIDAKVYDLTTWVSAHPGGGPVILGLCGHDGTAAFHGYHANAANPNNRLATFQIGVIGTVTPSPTPTTTTPAPTPSPTTTTPAPSPSPTGTCVPAKHHKQVRKHHGKLIVVPTPSVDTATVCVRAHDDDNDDDTVTVGSPVHTEKAKLSMKAKSTMKSRKHD